MPTPTSSTAIAKWVRNAAVTSATFVDDTSTTTGSTITSVVIHSTVLTGTSYSGIGLFTDPCGGNPKGDFYNLGIQAAATGGVSDGSGTIIQY